MTKVISFADVMRITSQISSNTALEDPEAEALYAALLEMPRWGLVVEVGCELGRSSSIIAQMQKELDFHSVHIDPYTEQGEYLKQWVEMMRLVGGIPAHSFAFLCMRTEQAHWYLDRLGYIDLAFIDGDHDYAGVTTDLALVAEKVRTNGLLLAHDYGNPGLAGVQKALDEYTASGLWSKVGVYGSLGIWRRK